MIFSSPYRTTLMAVCKKRFHIPGKSRFVDLLFTAALGVHFLTRLVTVSTTSIHG